MGGFSKCDVFFLKARFLKAWQQKTPQMTAEREIIEQETKESKF